jgi:hypothetical protein
MLVRRPQRRVADRIDAVPVTLPDVGVRNRHELRRRMYAKWTESALVLCSSVRG